MTLNKLTLTELLAEVRSKSRALFRWLLIQGEMYVRLALIIGVALISVWIVADMLFRSQADDQASSTRPVELQVGVIDTLELWIEERDAELQTNVTVRSSAFSQ